MRKNSKDIKKIFTPEKNFTPEKIFSPEKIFTPEKIFIPEKYSPRGLYYFQKLSFFINTDI